MRLVLLEQIPEDTELRARWNALASAVPRTQVFYTYEWAFAVQRAYGAVLCPLVCLGYDEQGSLCGVAALARDQKNSASFLCATTGDYCDFLTLPEHKAVFVGAVLIELCKRGIAELVLTNLPADSVTVEALRVASRGNGYHYYERTAYQCTQVVLANLERRPGRDEPILPRRKMVRHSLNAMSREGPIRVDHMRSWNQVQAILPEFMLTHVGRFLFTGRISNLIRPERRLFLEELAKLLSESGWLALTRMMSGNHSCAWNYGFRFCDTWFWYQPTFDSDLEKHSPGFCLLSKLVEDAARDPALRIVDMGLGAEEYKDRFANQTRETLYVTLNRSLVNHYRERSRYSASRLLRRSSITESGARALLQIFSRIKDRVSQQGLGATTRRVVRRLGEAIWLEDEVFFYEFAHAGVVETRPLRLRPIDLQSLADTAAQHADDQATLEYLLRAAARLRAATAEGYTLLDSNGKFLHFAWAMPFQGFYLSELNSKVDAPSSDSVMLFDCWTPTNQRGQGYYGRAIAAVAELLRARGNRPWIFSAKENSASVRGIEKAGFERRYSLTRQRLLGFQRIKGSAENREAHSVEEVSARA